MPWAEFAAVQADRAAVDRTVNVETERALVDLAVDGKTALGAF